MRYVKNLIISSAIVVIATFAVVTSVNVSTAETKRITETSYETSIVSTEEAEVDYVSEYERIVALIKEAAEIEGIDPKLAVAIARLETGNFASELFLNGHNFGGLLGADGYYKYKTEADGLVAYMNCLKWYRDNGMDTVDKMADTYCPGGTWAGRVKEIMKEL